MKKKIYLWMMTIFAFFIGGNTSYYAQTCPPLGSITASATSTPNTCAGNGTITATFTNNTNLGLQLVKSGSILNYVIAPSSPYTWTGLQPGTDYVVKVICKWDNSIVYKSLPVTITDNYVPISDANISISNVCTSFTKGGTITVNSVTGGTAPYTYSYYLSNSPSYDDSLSSYTSSNTANVTTFGTYQIRIKDACGNYKTFTRTINPTYEPVNMYWRSTKDCGSSNVTASFWWANGANTNQVITDTDLINMGGIKLKIYEQAADGSSNPQGSVLFDGTYISGTFTFPEAPSHKYYVETTNTCGETAIYTWDKTWDEDYHFNLTSTSANCGASEKMTIVGSGNTGYWHYPVSVVVKNSANTTVYTTTINDESSWTTPLLSLDSYTVTYTDFCGVTRSQSVANPQTGGPISISVYDYPMWRCGDIPYLTQTGTSQVVISVNGYLPDRQNAVITIISGPSNVGVQAGIIDGGANYGWSNMLDGNYIASITSCGVTNNYPFTVGSWAVLQQSLSSTASSFCSGGGNILSDKVYNGSYSNIVELYNASDLTTPIATSNTGNFYNVSPGNYYTKMKISDWCGDTPYYIDGNALTITNGSTGPIITAALGVICEDSSGNPLSTGTAYLDLAGVTPFTLQYKLSGSSTWTTINNAPTNVTINGLTANATYDVLLTDGCGGTYNTTVQIKTMDALLSENTSQPCYSQPYTLAMRYYAGATYKWTNPQGVVVSNTRIYNISNYDASYNGMYTCSISWGTCSTRYVFVYINGDLCGGPIKDFCFKDPGNLSPLLPSKHGITALGRAGTANGNWPMVRNGAHTVLEAKTKGFVVNRLTTVQKNALTPSLGMIVYDTDLDCLSIYDGTAWKCYKYPACPDSL